MSFALGNGAAASSGSAESGSELPEIETTDIGFLGVDKDCNIQFLPKPWPADALPSPTSSLLTISSSNGLVVGGGPDGLVLATTKSIREAISAKTGSGAKTKPFQPQGQITLPSRPSHVAFCAAESALAVAIESFPQLVVYEAASLGNGNPEPQISIQINGPLRLLAPNPSSTSDNLSSLVALVNTNGELSVADLKAGSLVNGQSGNVFRNGVASVAWSKLGKQMVAGLADGSCVQLDPQGVVKAEIPRPPALEGNKHVSSISWVEKNVFLAVYTPNESEDESGMIPDSDYYIIEHHQTSSYLYRQLPMLCSPFGLKRAPAYQFITRLSGYSDLQDALIVSSTVSTDLGLVTRVKTPFRDADETITGIFTTTSAMEDTRRATLPMNGDSETSPIGLALDLTATETVAYDVEKETKTPLPNLMALNNEGILSSWWFLYLKAIEAGIPYNVPSTASTTQQTPVRAPPAPPATGLASATITQPAFGQSSFGQTGFGTSQAQPSGFGKPSFGTPSAIGGSSLASTTPNKSPAPAFGSPSVLGQRPAQFGQAGFGGGTQPAFGQTGGLGGKGFGGFSMASPGKSGFATGAAAAGGGFGAFSQSSGTGFASLVANPAESPFAQSSADSPFGKPATDSPFGKPETNSPFGQPATNTSFGKPATDSPFGKSATDSPFGKSTTNSPFGQPAASPFGKPAAPSPFGAGDTTKIGDRSTGQPDKQSGSSDLFSMKSSFSQLLGNDEGTTSLPNKTMDDSKATSTTPSHPQPSKTTFSGFGAPQNFVTGPPKTSGPLFGTQSQMKDTPAAVQSSQPTTFFGGSNAATPLSPLSSLSEKTVVPSLDQEAEKDVEAPLPPDATSRAVYGPGDTSASSNVSKSSYEDAPLPPDFTQKKTAPKENGSDVPLPPDFLKKEKSPKAEAAPLPPDFLAKPKESSQNIVKAEEEEEAPLPPDFLSKPKDKKQSPVESSPVREESVLLPHESEGSDGDFEDSGEDITHDISPPNEPAESESADFKTSPESSFGGPASKESPGGPFQKVSVPETKSQLQTARPLFGEISQPKFPPSNPRSVAKSPRSPSPVRPGARRGFLRPEQTRSTSAPTGPGSMFSGLTSSAAKVPSSRFEQPLSQSDLIDEEESKAAVNETKRLASESQPLSSDDEDTLRRAELERPLVPVPTLDPFMPRQEYSGEFFKPGVPGQIERLYRDINSMVDTLGLNARSIAAYLLHEEENRAANLGQWQEIIFSDTPLDILDQEISVSDIENFDGLLEFLEDRLQEQRLQAVQEKINECQQLLNHDIFNLRDQCAHIQKTLDSYTDTVSIRAQPLSAEQASLQQDLRKASTTIQSQVTELEQGISLLRAKIADSSSANRSVSGRYASKKPTVEAVTSTITTMMNMAESKSSDIDVLEAQMKKLGIDLRSSGSREGSPISTPVKKLGFRVPGTPDSDGGRSAYQTPQSTSRFQSSLNGSARHSRLRSVNFQLDLISNQDSDERKARTRRRKEMVGNLKRAIGGRPIKVRTMDDE